MRSKLKVTTWVQHSVDSHPFLSISIGHPIPELRLFQNLTLKIKGQGHGWGHSSKSQRGCNLLWTHIPFVHMSIRHPIPELWLFQIWPWKSRVKVMGEVRVESHNVGLISYRFASLSFVWFDKFLAHGQAHIGQITMTLHNYRSRQINETLNGVNPSSGFRDMRSAKSGPNLCQIWQVLGPCASTHGANGQMTMTVHNYRPRQFHRTSNGENPSSGYRDMGSASLAAARPPARTPTHPPARTVTTLPLQPGGLRGKNGFACLKKF